MTWVENDAPLDLADSASRHLGGAAAWAWRLLRFVVRVVRAFLRNRGILLAGAVGYNTLLSAVPFLVVTVAALSLFFDEKRILGNLRPELDLLVPQQADTLLQTVEAFLQNPAATGVVSIVLLLFFSSIAFRMLEEAVAAIFLEASLGTRRTFWISALLPYVFILPLMIALFFVTLLTTALDALGDRRIQLLCMDISLTTGVAWLLRLGAFVGLVVLFAALYRILPVVRISRRRALIGGLFAAVLWRATGLIMVNYFSTISMVSSVYGSLATVIGLLIFLEVACAILLLGAQVIAELEASAAAGLPWHVRAQAGEVALAARRRVGDEPAPPGSPSPVAPTPPPRGTSSC